MLALLNRLESFVQNIEEGNSFLSYRRPFQRFIALMNDQLSHQKSLEEYAAELQLTKRKLNEVVKHMTGQTATNFIIDRLVLEAKRELCFSEKNNQRNCL